MTNPINSKKLQDASTGFQTLYDEAYAKVQPQQQIIAMQVPSDGAEEQYGWLGDLPEMREWLGNRVVHALAIHEFRIKNKDFELTIGVPRNAIADDKVGTFNPRFKAMGGNVARTPDKLVFGLLKDAFTGTCYDNQPFVDTDHPVLDVNGVEQSVSNFGGGTGNAWFLVDTSRDGLLPMIFQNRQDPNFVALDNPEDPGVFNNKEFVYGSDARWNAGYGLWQLIYGSKQPLTPENYAAAVTAFETMKGDFGKPLGLQANLLVVGGSNKTAAKTILNSEQIDGSTNIHRDSAELLVSTYLD